MQRHTIQFHWRNGFSADGKPWQCFDDFLASLNQEKRKKIRQERRKVKEAGISFEALRGPAISPEHWRFFYRCYVQTYLEHGNPPYLQAEFFERMQHDMPDYWLLVLARNASGEAIACSLSALSDTSASPVKAYGRYWGSLQDVDCLHFEACYYQTIEWCLAHGVQVFEGGAQGEHKMARALMPVTTTSGHWLSHPAFNQAVERYLEREKQGLQAYLNHLEARSPLKQTAS
jgi:predicted N-acyltransferase